MRRQCGGDLRLAFDRVYRVVLAAEHQRWTQDAGEVREHVEGMALAARFGEPLQHFRPVDRAARHVRIARNSRIQRNGQPCPGVERGLIGVALNLQEPAPRQRADFRAAEALEQLDAPLAMRATGGRGRDQHQFGGMSRMARRVGQRNHAAERCAEHDRAFDADHIAEGAHVVAPLRQVPALARTILASAIAAVVQIDDLRDVGQTGIGGFVDRVVGAGAAVKHQQGRVFPHEGAIRDELSALDVEEQPDSVDEHIHGPASLACGRSIHCPKPLGLEPLACFVGDTKPCRARAAPDLGQ